MQFLLQNMFRLPYIIRMHLKRMCPAAVSRRGQTAYVIRVPPALHQPSAMPPLLPESQPAAPLGEVVAPPPCEAAIAAEGWADVAALREDAQRQHVHYTHVRTDNVMDVQPAAFTRSAFWEHMLQVYKDVYPEPANTSGSILLFGAVAKERHAAAAGEGDALRAEHHHCPTYCSKRHYWRRVAQRSYEHYRVKLHAATHEGYTSMYSYIATPSAKKPLSELDPEIYLSPEHPRGDLLCRLLEAGAVRQRAVGAARARTAQGQKRERVPDLYDLVVNKGLRTVDAIQAHAQQEAVDGRCALASFCTRQGHKLPQMVKNALAMEGASQRLQRGSMSLLDKLSHAATHLTCSCGGVWAQGAVKILVNNGIQPDAFCAAMRRAFEHGALRGTNIACVGSGGCGKSTLLEPLEQVFACMPKPQHGSTFPFTDMAAYDIMLWQDYEHSEATLCFTDLLSMFVGESFGVRVPGAKNEKVSNKAPLFYSGRAPISATKGAPNARAEHNRMMGERFTTFSFECPLPLPDRRADWPKCARCASAFYLHGPAPGPSSSSGAPAVPVPPASSTQLLAELSQLAAMHTAGALTEEEFSAAKAKILGLHRSA